MDPVLIYDIQSENMSQISEQHHKETSLYIKELKETEVTQKGNTKMIQVRSHESQIQQYSEKILKQEIIQNNIIFHEESMQRITSSISNEETTRGFLKEKQEQIIGLDWDQQYQQESQEEEQGYKEVSYKREYNKQMIIPQQKKLQNNIIQLKANTDLFIKQIIPKDYKLTCYLAIQYNFMGLHSKYRLFLGQQRQFLISAKKQVFKYYSNYIISKHPSEIHRRSDIYIGFIKANFIGTSFQLYTVKQQYESLKLNIQYKKNIAGFNGPRSFKVTKPNPKNQKQYNLNHLIERNEHSKLIALQTMQPSLKNGKYRLDFGGKVKIASSKNFILARQQQKEMIGCLTFGKIKQNQFIMQIGYPLSVFQAFGICLSSLDSKILVN